MHRNTQLHLWPHYPDASTDIVWMRCILFANLSNNTMTCCVQSQTSHGCAASSLHTRGTIPTRCVPSIDITQVRCILFTTSSNNTRTHCIQFPYITRTCCILFTNSNNHTRTRCIPSTDITRMPMHPVSTCSIFEHAPGAHVHIKAQRGV